MTIHNGLVDWYDEYDSPLRIPELEVKTLVRKKFMKNYLKGEKVTLIDNDDHIADMEASYPEDDNEWNERIISNTDDLMNMLKSTSELDAVVVASHWKIVEYFSDYHSNKHIGMGYWALSCLKYDPSTDETNLVLNRHYAY